MPRCASVISLQRRCAKLGKNNFDLAPLRSDTAAPGCLYTNQNSFEELGGVWVVWCGVGGSRRPLHKEPRAAKGRAWISEGSQRFDPNLNMFAIS